MTNYNDMESKILNHEAFNGSSVSAICGADGSYVVYSYWTKMLIVKYNGTIIFNNQYYSRTTRRIQGIIARLLSHKHNFSYETRIGKRGGLHIIKDAVYFFDGLNTWERVDGNANFANMVSSL